MARKTTKENKARFNKLAEMQCVTCHGYGVQIHHVIGHGLSGMGMKSPDEMTIPLCLYCHDVLHRHGHKSWERKHGSQLDLLKEVDDRLSEISGLH